MANNDGETRALEEALKRSEERLRHVQAIAKLGSWYLDVKQNKLTWSEETYKIFGVPFGKPLGYQDFLACIPLDERQRVDAAWQAALKGASYDIEHRIVVAGKIKWVHEKADLVFDATGALLGGVGTVQDITDRKEAEEERDLFAKVFEHSGQAIIITDRENRIIAVNRAFEKLTGYAFAEVIGQNPRILASGHTQPETYRQMWQALERVGYWEGELWDRRKDGSIYPKWTTISVVRDVGGSANYYVATFSDISERKEAEKRIYHLAHHDALTGLANRYSFENRLEQALLTAQRENGQLAVLFIDLDRFKTINDTLGHQVGDRLLQEAAQRLQACVRASDIVARLGGDEFVVVLSHINEIRDVTAVAEKILAALAVTYEIDGSKLYCSASIGVGVFPSDGGDATTLMKSADTALYHAKEHGRNNFQFCTAELNAAAAERMVIEHELHAALQQRQFEVYYQPQVNAIDGQIRCVEALVRWHHPRLGFVAPDKFIPIAEESGLIDPLGDWVLAEACRQLAVWHAAGLDSLKVAVNLSARQLRNRGLVDRVRELMTRYRLGEDVLELEITESAAMEEPALTIDLLSRLRDLGVRLAIDDFGTGYSSLAYLKRLPIHTLKLDRIFVRDIETDPNDAVICRSAIALAHSLGLQLVAEGVENAAQRDFLASHGCDMLQGYLFGKPSPAMEWTARWNVGDIGVP